MPETRPHSTPESSYATPPSRVAPAQFRHVLACLDHSPQAPEILSQAAAIAEVMGAELTALRVMETDLHAAPRPADPVDWELTRREEEAELGKLAEDVGVVPEMQPEVMGGTPADCICHKARESGADLIALGVGGRDHWGELSLGGTVRKVAEHVAGSVLIVPDASTHDKPPRAQGGRILVALDTSSQAEAALPIAVRIAQSLDAELVLLHAVPDIRLSGFGPPEAGDETLRDSLCRRNERVAKSYLERIRALLPADRLRARVRLLSGEDPRRAIARAVREEGAGLVILSARGLGAHSDRPIGSTAEYLLAGATVPVLLVRRDDAAARRNRQAAPRRPHLARAPR
ncbi:universal stress protein [Acidimangrovimonas pyrenivorans]|uniref:Universal stress protein n=1 Tax=Acidimangrovimonas pyrenivorans TaxID=2030798 RepID=A0ABV7AH55_9RHOB